MIIRALADITRRHWGQAGLTGTVLVATSAAAVQAHAQGPPADAVGEVIGATGGDPWALVAVAGIMALGQIASALREWARQRKADADAAERRSKELETLNADLKARLAVAQARLDVLYSAQRDGITLPVEES